jgi:hypothetical protein
LSIKLANTIKRFNKQNHVCVITDAKSKFENKAIDMVKVLKQDDGAEHKTKWANEWKAFNITPFTHTIKLEADMLWTTNTDWWWYHLWQNDLVFSVDCKNYRDQTIKDTAYRQIFIKNQLPNIYNGLMYFRKSKQAQKFFKFAEYITKNWTKVKTTMLINCHDKYPSTDVVFALAYRMLDPTNKKLLDYEWFTFIHHKPAIHNLTNVKDHNQYLYPNKTGDAVYLGERRLSRVWHYFEKELNVRTT